MSYDATTQPTLPQLQSQPHLVLRIGRTLLVCFLIIASLLTFPSGIVWMVAFWLIVTSAAVGSGEKWLPSITLLGLGAILILKQPERSIPMYVLVTSVGYTAVLFALTERRQVRAIEMLILWVLFGWFAYSRWADATANRPPRFAPGNAIACLGDSLTDFGYPDVLREKVTVPVLDFGRNGCTTREALRDLLPMIEMQQPQMVIVELGGHDYRESKTRTATKRNLTEIIHRIRDYGGNVILCEIPRGFISDPYFGLERELAREFDLQLVPDTAIRSLILTGPGFPPGSWLPADRRLSDDNLHPNDKGNEVMALATLKALERVYGRAIAK